MNEQTEQVRELQRLLVKRQIFTEVLNEIDNMDLNLEDLVQTLDSLKTKSAKEIREVLSGDPASWNKRSTQVQSRNVDREQSLSNEEC